VPWQALIEAALLPPGLPLLLLTAGLLLRRRLLGTLASICGLALLYLASAPFAADAFLAGLEQRAPALTAVPAQAQAIVVLGAGRLSAPEYGGGETETVNHYGLERLRYAAYLARRSGLPLLVTGGSTVQGQVGVAELSRPLLETEFGVSPRWIEASSRNTYENAANAYAILAPLGIERVLVVTHAAHMPRALWSFRQVGFEPVAAPTGFAARGRRHADPLLRLLPSAHALARSRFAAHEWLGLAWYRLRYSDAG
jgi:uncharacterized SAM-binding protein YcdF (DUF218 family)